MYPFTFGQKYWRVIANKKLYSKKPNALIGIDYNTLSNIEKEEGYPQVNSIKGYLNVYEEDYMELNIHYFTERILKRSERVDFRKECRNNAANNLK